MERQEQGQEIRILRFPDAERRTGLSRSTIYNRIRANAFPRPVRLGVRAVGFVEQEVNSYLASLAGNRGARAA